jgi:glyoxylase-like metal-dependent hydrolase (beta-lactamase superfamily II)
MCPPLARHVVNRDGYLVAHCLVIETSEGVVLVDTGLGTYDLANPVAAMGRPFVALVRTKLDLELPLVRQLDKLGLDAADVRHIVVTHLDVDHAGGLPDFPHAKVHTYRPEHDAAQAPRSFNERRRYRKHQFANASFVLHDSDGQGETWKGFAAVRPILGLDLALVPLIGHTRGHCGVAVRAHDGWLLHCGDAYFHADQMAPDRERCSAGLRAFQRLMAVDNAARLANVARLRELATAPDAAVRLFCAHDPTEFKAFSAGSAVRLFA